jgi:hypothetical protein
MGFLELGLEVKSHPRIELDSKRVELWGCWGLNGLNGLQLRFNV